MATTKDKSLNRNIDIGLVGVLLAYFFAKLFFIGYIPIWDGYLYFTQLLNAVNTPFTPNNFIAFGHPSLAYMLLMSVSQYIDMWNFYLLNLENSLLGMLAIFSFYKIIAYFYDQKSKGEIVLLSLCFAFNPVFFGNSINFNLDFPVVVFFLAAISAFLYRRWLFFSLFGIAMIFSKESGTFLYMELIALLFLFYLIEGIRQYRKNVPNKEKSNISIIEPFKELFSYNYKNILLALLPLLFFVLYFIYRVYIKKVSLFWGGTNLDSKSFNFLVNLPWNHIKSISTQIFLLNFQWILTFVICLFIIKASINKFIKKDNSILVKEKKVYFLMLIYIFMGFSYINFTFDTYSNTRYILPAIPLLIIFFYGALFNLISNKRIRIFIIAIITILFFIQTFSTIDPLSKKIYGTFNFGDHQMLRMVTITREGVGYAGRDQLVYNAEYTVINKLVQKLFQEKIIKEDSTIYLDNYADYFVFSAAGNLSTKTNNKQISDLLKAKVKPRNIIYINFPWMAKDENTLGKISRYYKIKDIKTVNHKGYKLDIYFLYLKG